MKMTGTPKKLPTLVSARNVESAGRVLDGATCSHTGNDMAKQIVKGQEWDIEDIDGNTVTLKGGQQIEVNDKTLATIKKPKTLLSRSK